MGFLLGVFTTLRALYLMLLPSIVIHRHNYHVLMTSDVISVKAVRGARGERGGTFFDTFHRKEGMYLVLRPSYDYHPPAVQPLRGSLVGLPCCPPAWGASVLGASFLGGCVGFFVLVFSGGTVGFLLEDFLDEDFDLLLGDGVFPF